ncbi:hypothetical protein PM082_013695 [Marasmius tenuissimus]|nr:hypothetical protein PM082_013695 [Marasmius tenuissimus]
MSTTNFTLPDGVLPLLQVEKVITFPIVTVLVMCIVYGFYVLLFGLCVYVLRRSDILHRELYTICISILFLLSTSVVVMRTTMALHSSSVTYLSVRNNDYQGLREYFIGHDKSKLVLYVLEGISLILANLVADFMLIHRCYVIWQSKKRVALPLVSISCAITEVTTTASAILCFIGYGDMSVEANRALYSRGGTIGGIGFIISASFNLALTLLTAGRIWWLTRTLRPSKTRVARTVNKIILESGMLYPLIMIVHLAVVNSPIPLLDSFPLVVLAAGIAPTLIIVLTRLAIHVVEDSDATYSRNPTSSQLFADRSFRLSRGPDEP